MKGSQCSVTHTPLCVCVCVCERVTPAANLAQSCVSLGEVIKQRGESQRSLSVGIQLNTDVSALINISHTSYTLARQNVMFITSTAVELYPICFHLSIRQRLMLIARSACTVDLTQGVIF